MALFIFTMIIMFAFTTNVGMLVHAKINLQNAADAAAYAGAAVQARQLTAVGYLNWEMRRALKDFLFYYTVRGEASALPCYPRDPNGGKPGYCTQTGINERYNFAIYDPREKFNEYTGPFLPSVCIIFDKDNNYCQKLGVPGIPEFPGGGHWGVADPIVQSVQNATNQIIEKKVNDCLGRTDINAQFLAAWLFNLNPIQGGDAVIVIGNDRDDPFPYSDGLERIGVLPREAMLRARIDNFEEALNLNLANEGLSNTITDTTMGALHNASQGGGKTLDYYERPIQAFLSAKNNLPSWGSDNGIFQNVQLTELIPNQAGASTTDPGFQNKYIRNPPVLVKFKDEVSNVQVAFSLFQEEKIGDRGNCFQYRVTEPVKHFPFGVSKWPGLITYYAVHVQAKAHLLFSPFGGNGIVTLSAYSAAKPFGSRVGKDLGHDGHTEDTQMIARGLMKEGDQFNTINGPGGTPRFPNVLVSEDDHDTQVDGFTTNGHLGYIFLAMQMFGLDAGPRLAGAYAPWEIGYYTVPANFKQPEDVGLFEDNPEYNGKYFTMAAPLMPYNNTVGMGYLTERVEEYLEGGLVDIVTKGKYDQWLKKYLSSDQWASLFAYLKGRNEDVNLYIPDPLLNDRPEMVAYAKNFGQRYTVAGMTNPQRRQFTSWNNQKTARDQDIAPPGNIPDNSELGFDIGRSGYSVKFVSFRSLQQGGLGTNDPIMPDMQWQNPFPRVDAGGAKARIEDDLKKIRH
jgi:hypothetical protein